MRIGIVASKINLTGGGERYAVDLVRELTTLGHELFLFSTCFDSVPAETKNVLIDMPLRELCWSRNYFFCRMAAVETARYRNVLDVVYSIGPFYPTDAAFLGGGVNKHWLHVRLNSPMCEWLYPLVSHNHLIQNYLEKKVSDPNYCKKIVVNSHLVKRHVIDYGKVNPERVEVIPTGVNTTRFNLQVREKYRLLMREKLNIPAAALAIVYCSQNWKRKGLMTIINALTKLPSADRERYHLLVIGKGEPKTYRQAALKGGVSEKNLHFLGTTPEPEKLFASGDIGVLPTQYDPCASVTLETLACGLPSITTEQNGASELIAPETTGFVLDNHLNVEQLTHFFRLLLDDDRRTKMGLAAAESMKNQTFTQVALRTAEVLNKIAVG